MLRFPQLVFGLLAVADYGPWSNPTASEFSCYASPGFFLACYQWLTRDLWSNPTASEFSCYASPGLFLACYQWLTSDPWSNTTAREFSCYASPACFGLLPVADE